MSDTPKRLRLSTTATAAVTELLERFACDQCDHTYSNKANLDKHKRVDHQGVRYTCDCGAEFKSKYHLETHVASIHHNERHVCGECSKTFTRKDHLVAHMNSHMGIRYSCDCGATFTQRSSLNKHIKSIHLKYRYTCEICGSIFTEKGNLSAHKRLLHT